MDMSASRLSHSGRVQRVLSPGGIEAWLVEEHAVPLFALEFSFRAGSAQDAAGRAGTASLLSSLLDEGAGDLDAAAFQEALADQAVELSFHAGRDWFQGSLRTLTRNAGEAVRLTRLAVTRARLDPEAVERVRAETLAGLRYEANDPDTLASRRFFERGFAGHPYAAAPSGTVETVAAISRDDLESFRTGALARDTLVVTCVGAISAETLATYLDDIFGDLPATSRVTPTPQAAFAGLGEVDVRDLDVPQTTFVFGAPGLARTDPDFIAAAVVNHVLGEGTFTSRLWQEVRERRGLAYSVRTWLHPLRRGPLYYGSTSTKNERAREALDIIRTEIARMAAEGPSEAELTQAKRYMTGSYALRFDTSTKIAGELMGIAFEGLGIDYIDRRNDLVMAVTPDDARRAATRVFGDGRLLVAAAGRPVGLA